MSAYRYQYQPLGRRAGYATSVPQPDVSRCTKQRSSQAGVVSMSMIVTEEVDRKFTGRL